ncbi:hypothetical protein [Chitinophaga pinensis]|uniref:hypothetical protein n=1 Tax=Chitinophaga pinensis TaxID=79329 RepID=UPI001649457B|nr:hypothetical protein [Chitinophaga pinensis]
MNTFLCNHLLTGNNNIAKRPAKAMGTKNGLPYTRISTTNVNISKTAAALITFVR